MQLRGSYTPSTASWDQYNNGIFGGEYEVVYSGFYNSPIHYMIIED